MEGDIAAAMVAGIDKFLLREIELSVGRRENYWKRDFTSPEAYNKSIEPNRQRLKKILGVVDERVSEDGSFEFSITEQSIVGGSDFEVIQLNRHALERMECERKLRIIPGATHLFEEAGTLESAAAAAYKKGK